MYVRLIEGDDVGENDEKYLVLFCPARQRRLWPNSGDKSSLASLTASGRSPSALTKSITQAYH